jgi:hypothetical protein
MHDFYDEVHEAPFPVRANKSESDLEPALSDAKKLYGWDIEKTSAGGVEDQQRAVDALIRFGKNKPQIRCQLKTRDSGDALEIELIHKPNSKKPKRRVFDDKNNLKESDNTIGRDVQGVFEPEGPEVFLWKPAKKYELRSIDSRYVIQVLNVIKEVCNPEAQDGDFTNYGFEKLLSYLAHGSVEKINSKLKELKINLFIDPWHRENLGIYIDEYPEEPSLITTYSLKVIGLQS